MQLTIHNHTIDVSDDTTELANKIELCDMLKAHTKIELGNGMTICANCGSIMAGGIQLNNENCYQPWLRTFNQFTNGKAYVLHLRNWMLSSGNSRVALAYSEATGEISDDIENAIRKSGYQRDFYAYVKNILGNRKHGKAREVMLRLCDRIGNKDRMNYYKNNEIEWYNRIAGTVTMRREQLMARNTEIREQMKNVRGLDRAKLVDELESNILKRKVLKDSERKAYTKKMSMRTALRI